ncbi:MAG: ABC transporter substrate-binding protein, partial [Chloroflexota bacterium]|nr:ABC transporter substrate-binding protein [Chloroflexota bacterium]
QAAQDASAAAAEAAGLAAEAVEAVGAAAAAIEAGMTTAEDAEFSQPWPLDQVDLDASIVGAIASHAGGVDQARTGSAANVYSHGAVFNGTMEVDPRAGNAIPSLAAPEWIDPVTLRASVVPAPFHDGSILTAHDMVFSYDRMAGKAAYHQGGETTDHPGGWSPSNIGRSAADWVRNEAVDDRTWSFELPGPDAGFFVVNLATTGEVVIMSQADTEARGDLAMDTQPMGTGPLRFVSHEDDTDFVFERFEEHFLPVDYPFVVSRYAHHKHQRVVVRPEIQSQLAGLEAGEIDVVPDLGPTNVVPYLDDPDFTVQYQPGINGAAIQVLYPNLYPQTMPDGSPNPFLDFRVRRAANHAINRQAIIDNLLLGQGHYPLFTFAGVYGYPTPEQRAEVEYNYDPELARQLMAEAGYADGFEVPLYWTTDWGGQAMSDMVPAVAQDLAAIGIRTQTEAAIVAEYFSDAYLVGGPDRPVGLYWMWANIVRDIGSMWDCCVGPESYFTKLGGEGVMDPALHEMYNAQRAELDPERRAAMTAELMLEHARQAWLIFIVEAPDAVITPADVNWPKGGSTGFAWGGSAYAIQRRKAT